MVNGIERASDNTKAGANPIDCRGVTAWLGMREQKRNSEWKSEQHRLFLARRQGQAV
jgi:hypothetical protein